MISWSAEVKESQAGHKSLESRWIVAAPAEPEEGVVSELSCDDWRASSSCARFNRGRRAERDGDSRDEDSSEPVSYSASKSEWWRRFGMKRAKYYSGQDEDREGKRRLGA